jgi:DNA-binding transcriptional LysR family regulator
MELRELEAVVVVAEQGSLTRAATIMNLSVSAVSNLVKKLEVELGAQLFQRLPRGMALTAAGEALLEPARRTLWDAEAAAGAVGAVGGLLAGRVHMVGIRTFTTPFAEMVAGFVRLHPRVLITIHQPEGDVLVGQLVRSGECEIGVMRGGAVPDDLAATPIGDEEIVVIVPEGHPFRGRESVRTGELDGQPMVAPPVGSALRATFDAMFAGAHVAADVVVEAENHEMVVELARLGVGLAVTSLTSVPVIDGRVAHAVPLDPPARQGLVLVTRKGPVSPAVSAFLDFAAARPGAGAALS